MKDYNWRIDGHFSYSVKVGPLLQKKQESGALWPQKELYLCHVGVFGGTAAYASLGHNGVDRGNLAPLSITQQDTLAQLMLILCSPCCLVPSESHHYYTWQHGGMI